MVAFSTCRRTLWHAQGVRVPTHVFATPQEAVARVVDLVQSTIRERRAAGKPCVLGLPTGSTPVGIYRQLVRLHRDENLDFSNVITFNLDEYYRLEPTEVQSYHRFMRENLFDHVNIRLENIYIPQGNLPEEKIDEHCADYERKIRELGGIDLLLLGIGQNGHIGFNEPGSPQHSRTRLARLDPITRRDAASAFFGEEKVPAMAITMGVGTILEARKIVLLAFGEHKANIVARALEQQPNENCPASVLQRHADATFFVDLPAAAELTVAKTPWLVGRVEWDWAMIRQAVLWLSLSAGKALLKLTAADFRQYNLHELLRDQGPAPRLCEQVFNDMLKTLCTSPAGSTPRRVICFSPHPDDDVISMGGTLIRLRQQDHDVHIAYMTTGNVAVHDHDAIRFANFISDFNHHFGLESQKTLELEKKVQEFLAQKGSGQIDSPEVSAIKTLVRKTEAIAGAAVVGVNEEKLHFLDLPFYRTGSKTKKPLGPEDIEIVYRLLDKLQPSQIYVAGDLADPHGTHRVCAEAIFEAVERYRSEGKEVRVLLYRGAWQEFEPHQIEMAVPLSPEDMERKKAAIFRHQSQKDGAMFLGSTDGREFWQRAEDRNRNTAKLYDQLGLPEYHAMEGFVEWKGTPI